MPPPGRTATAQPVSANGLCRQFPHLQQARQAFEFDCQAAVLVPVDTRLTAGQLCKQWLHCQQQSSQHLRGLLCSKATAQ